MELQLPTLSLNGSHAPTMVQALLDAHCAVQVAIRATQWIAPSQRDYPTNWTAAQTQHADRLAALHEVSEQLVAEAEAIQDMHDARS